MVKENSPTPWSVQPLNGKYYGTEIVDAHGNPVCTIWDHGHARAAEANRPSSREIAEHGPFASEAELHEYCSDGHYESARDYANAELIVAAVNTYNRS